MRGCGCGYSYFIRISVTTSLLPFPSLHTSPSRPPTTFPTPPCVTTNCELHCISTLHTTHYQRRPCGSKWKLHVSLVKCHRASQHTTSHHYSNCGFSFPTNCTGTAEYLYCLLNVCYMFWHSVCIPSLHKPICLLLCLLQWLSYRAWSIYIYIYIYRYIYKLLYFLKLLTHSHN